MALDPTMSDFSPPENLPLDLQLDLLVDEELPEEQRRALLLSLDGEPGRWRDLSIRFLERQVERKAIGQLIAGEAPLPVETATFEFRAQSIRHPGFFRRSTALAAGLFVAAASALITIYFVNHGNSSNAGGSAMMGKDQPEVITTMLPGSLWNTDGAMDVKVPIRNVAVTADTPVLFPSDNSSQPPLRRTVVIKPDGAQKALIIPVTNMQFQ
jgi:hypothetical protein